jgi:predicted AAA+ superfamily ATPase
LSKSIGLARQTIEEYLFILENTYIIKLLPSFSQSSKVEINKAPKIFFYDTGLLQMLWLSSFSNTSSIGNIFETSIFSELVKKYGIDNIRFWRNKNQNEIDFILKDKRNILPIEVKKSFHNFRKSSIKGFLEKYNIEKFKVVSIEGKKENSFDFYPWEI